jgi:hypothetical protein
MPGPSGTFATGAAGSAAGFPAKKLCGQGIKVFWEKTRGVAINFESTWRESMFVMINGN